MKRTTRKSQRHLREDYPGQYIDGPDQPPRRLRGPQKAPTKLSVTIRFDRDVLDYYRGSGPGWQTRMNADLLRLTTQAIEQPRRTRRKGGR